MPVRPRPLRDWAWVTAVVLFVWLPFLRSSHVDNESFDWTYRGDYTAYALHALFDDHQFPFWVTSGRFEQLRVKGVHDFFANPETDVLSLVTLLARPLGYLGAVKVTLVACLAAGVHGCRRLLRAFSGRASPLALLLLALLVLCNGTVVANVLIGHVQFITLLLFPLALALLVEAADVARPLRARALRASAAGAICAVAYYAGNTHPLVHFLCLFVGAFTLLSAVLAPRNAWRMLTAASVLGLAFVGLAAFKLLPGVADFEAYHTNYLVRYDGWHDLAFNVLTPWRHMVGGYPHERNAYVGWGGIAVLALAVTGVRRKTLPLLAIAGSLPFVMFAHGGDWLLELPLLRTQGALTRCMLDAFLALGIVAGVGVNDVVPRLLRVRRRWLRRLSLGVGVALACVVAIDLHENVVGFVELACTAPMPVASGPFDEPPSLVPVHPRAASVALTSVRANVFQFHFTERDPEHPEMLIAPDLPLVARRPHLRVVGGAEQAAVNGKLAVLLRGASGDFRLEFSDRLVWWGLATTVVTLLGLLGLAVASFRASRRRDSFEILV